MECLCVRRNELITIEWINEFLNLIEKLLLSINILNPAQIASDSMGFDECACFEQNSYPTNKIISIIGNRPRAMVTFY